MKGILKMLTGQGEKENRAARKQFDDAIPATGTDNHPAVSGPLANTSHAFDYRRANAHHGPRSKRQHAAQMEALRAEYQTEKAHSRGTIPPFREWLAARDG